MGYWQTTDTRSWYQKPETLTSVDTGNWALIPIDASITVAPRMRGTLSDVVLSGRNAFIAFDGERVVSGKGLEYFVETELSVTHDDTIGLVFRNNLVTGDISPWKRSIPTAIFDNHNHALFFWAKALEQGFVSEGVTLVHIDMHSDLWPNEYTIDPTKLRDLSYMASFTNLACNVGNYIVPAVQAGLIGEMIRIEGESELELARDALRASANDLKPANLILNLDLDIFAPDLDDIDFELKCEVIRGYAARAAYITIATSPFFIDEERALLYLRKVFF